ncbi:MAG TPA: glycosyl hydrolase [Elusimicrobiota bacterium]|nr:glycosyl hydrolase [Elusimicrobiota bacterium]
MKALLLAALLAAPAAADDFAPQAGGVVGQMDDVKNKWGGKAQSAPFAAAAPEAELSPEQTLQAWAHACPAIAAYWASSHSPAKRGLGVSKSYSGGAAVLSDVSASWYYTWTAVPLTGGTGEFVPLLQYPHNEADVAILKKDLGALAPGTGRLLGFNEPDIGPKLPDPPTTTQAEGLLTRLAGFLPPGLEKSVKLGSPALASPILYDKASKRQEPNPWLSDFMDDSAKAAAAPGRRVDFVAAHLYAGISIEKTDSPELAAAKVQAAVKGFLDRLHALEQAYPDKEIWITEMGLMDTRKTEDIAGPDDVHFSPKDDACFMAQTVGAMDADPRVARYAWFNADEAHPQLKTLPSALLSHGKPTPLALLYKQ